MYNKTYSTTGKIIFYKGAKNMKRFNESDWTANRTHSDLPIYQKTSFERREFRKTKGELMDVLEDFLIMLPADNPTCGIAKVLGEWLHSEVEKIPDYVVDTNP